jgi:hypothetical protein
LEDVTGHKKTGFKYFSVTNPDLGHYKVSRVINNELDGIENATHNTFGR